MKFAIFLCVSAFLIFEGKAFWINFNSDKEYDEKDYLNDWFDDDEDDDDNKKKDDDDEDEDDDDDDDDDIFVNSLIKFFCGSGIIFYFQYIRFLFTNLCNVKIANIFQIPQIKLQLQ